MQKRGRLREATRPTAVLLKAIAKAKPAIAHEETAVITDLVAEMRERLTLPHDLEAETNLRAELLRIVPTGNLITRATRAVLADDHARTALPSWIARMAVADGQVSGDEASAMEVLKATIRRLG